MRCQLNVVMALVNSRLIRSSLDKSLYNSASVVEDRDPDTGKPMWLDVVDFQT